MRIILSTANKGKIEEIKEMLKGSGVEVATLKDHPELTLPPETGESFKDNALIKARYVSNATGMAALADDSGLEVDALEGMPGIHSARYAGREATDKENIEKLLSELRGVPLGKRRARFKCVVAFVEPGGGEATFEGEFEGLIAAEPRGSGGFGYDPVFFVPERNKTVAQMSSQEKNSVSHRAMALEKFRIWFSEVCRKNR